MRRFLPSTALAVVCALSSACQSYSFNPVSQCVIQPGSERVAVSDISTADVLFVVDDSGSMAGEQSKLAAAFDSFISSLDAYNVERVGNGLKPFDFHIAVTTTSVFQSRDSGAICATSCGTATNVCCLDGTDPLLVPKTCPAGTGCGGGFTCKKTCQGHEGEDVCCDASGATLETVAVACDDPGAKCGTIQNRYAFQRRPHLCGPSSPCTTVPYTSCTNAPAGELGCGGYSGDIDMCCDVQTCAEGCDSGFACGNCSGLTNVCCYVPPPLSSSPTYVQGTPEFLLACTPGVGVEGELYPRGSFVGVGTNPRVLHYDKKLYGTERTDGSGTWDPVPPATAENNQGFTRAELRSFFNANVLVGTCGSGQEQGLQAARLAVGKALAGKQRDTRHPITGAVVPEGVTASWPHAGAKLVVAYVGDEDDCSSPEDPFQGVVLVGPAGNDSCVADAALPLEQQKEFRVEDLVHDLQALGRPVGAAFVVSANQTTCVDAACTALRTPPNYGRCCDYQCTGTTLTCGNNTCGGQAAGSRFLQAASALRGDGADVVTASICDPGAIACTGAADCASLLGTTCANGTLGGPGMFCRYSGGPLAGSIAGTEGFGPILSRIAEIVKPPSALELPTQPANAEITLLRITSSIGITRKFCNGPALPPPPPLGGYLTDPDAVTSRAIAFNAAVAAGYDWWFTETRDQIDDADKAPWTASSFIYINHETNGCEPNPGEVYSADYLGALPPGGCTSQTQCSDELGTKTDWTCFAGRESDGSCTPLVAGVVGSCVCGKVDEVCPP